MRVLHVTNGYPSPESPNANIFIAEQIHSLEQEIGTKIDVYVIQKDTEGLWSYVRCLFDLIRAQKRYDIVHCHHIYVGLIGILSVPRNKLIISFLNDGKFNVAARIPLLGSALFYIATKASKWKILKSSIPSHCQTDFTYLIPNGVDLSRFEIIGKAEARRQLGLSVQDNYALFVSANRIRAAKRLDIFEKVVVAANRRGVNLRPLVISNVPRDKVPLFFNAADVHILTSDYEGSPNSVREALACGTPVVAREVGGVKSLLEGCPFSVSVAASDPAEIADALIDYVKIPLGVDERHELREHLTANGYDIHTVAAKIANIYRRMIEAQ